mgnify:CR=1 FL=1
MKESTPLIAVSAFFVVGVVLWYKGADIPMRSWMEPHGKYQQVYDWCKATFDIHYFKMFEDSVWFIDEQDAMFCQLKWS